MEQSFLSVFVKMLCVYITLEGWDIGIPLNLKRVVIGIFHIIARHILEFSHRHFITLIHIPIFLGSAKRQMRFLKTDSKKKRLIAFFQLMQRLDRLFRYYSVNITVVGNIGAFRSDTPVGKRIGGTGCLDIRKTP